MFTLKNTKTNTVTRFRPWTDGTLVFVEQDNDGHLGIQADMEKEEAREIWRICVKNGASQVKRLFRPEPLMVRPTIFPNMELI